MKTKQYDKAGKPKGDITLPKVFDTSIRPDILLKVFEAERYGDMQAYGSKKGAGAGYSASGIIKRKRHDWKSSYGKGISRIPRKILSRSGASFNWVGATVSNTRGGRRPHAPKVEKNTTKKINKKEYTIAFASALAGSIDPRSLEKKYSSAVVSGIVFDSAITSVKTKEFVKALEAALANTYGRVIKKRQVRAGKGKMRGRKYKSNAGVLFVIGSSEDMKQKSVTVRKVSELQIKDLSPNGEPGRVTCFTESAIKELGEKQ